jgi:hypothetical protein
VGQVTRSRKQKRSIPKQEGSDRFSNLINDSSHYHIFYLNIRRLVVHHSVVDVFMINFPVQRMLAFLSLKEVCSNLSEVPNKKDTDTALRAFWE